MNSFSYKDHCKRIKPFICCLFLIAWCDLLFANTNTNNIPPNNTAVFAEPTLDYLDMLTADALATQLLAQSKQLSAKKQYQQAIELLEKATKLNPKSIDIKLAIARNWMWQGNYPAAEDLLNQLANEFPADSDVALTQGYLYYYKGDFADARALFKMILSRAPNYQDAVTGLQLVEKASSVEKTSSSELPTPTPISPLVVLIEKPILIPEPTILIAPQPSPDSNVNSQINNLINTSQKQSKEKKFSAAIATLQKALKISPNNLDIKIQLARNYSWQKNYSSAQQLLKNLLATYPDNLDIQVVQGYLYYYQQQLSAASQTFLKILKKNPQQQDAQQGLAQVEKAQKAKLYAQQKPVSAPKPIASKEPIEKEYKWRLDSGVEYSKFSRRPQPSWNQEFLLLTRLFNDGKTAIHAGTTRYYQFQQQDMQYAIGIDQRFNQRFSTYLYTYTTPDAVFRPYWGVSGGGGVRLDNLHKDTTPFWLTLDLKNDHYPLTGSVQTINPGWRVEPAENWQVIVREITVVQGLATYGGLIQLNGQIKKGWLFNIGYADAPEIQDNVAVRTKTIFGGTAIDITRALTLHLEYTHDNRENSWIRSAYFGSFTYRF